MTEGGARGGPVGTDSHRVLGTELASSFAWLLLSAALGQEPHPLALCALRRRPSQRSRRRPLPPRVPCLSHEGVTPHPRSWESEVISSSPGETPASLPGAELTPFPAPELEVAVGPSWPPRCPALWPWRQG